MYFILNLILKTFFLQLSRFRLQNRSSKKKISKIKNIHENEDCWNFRLSIYYIIFYISKNSKDIMHRWTELLFHSGVCVCVCVCVCVYKIHIITYPVLLKKKKPWEVLLLYLFLLLNWPIIDEELIVQNVWFRISRLPWRQYWIPYNVSDILHVTNM